MRWNRVRFTLGCWFAVAACSTAAPVPESLQALVDESPEGMPARFAIDGNRIIASAVAIGPGALPAVVRTTIDAVAPGGEVLFQGREWGPRGAGFRVEKRYRDGAKEHVRSVLVAADGRVLERAHSVPIGEVPQHVLAAAMRVGSMVDEARIVSGPEREEHWSLVVRDRLGRTFVVTIGLDGRSIGSCRRVVARVDA